MSIEAEREDKERDALFAPVESCRSIADRLRLAQTRLYSLLRRQLPVSMELSALEADVLRDRSFIGGSRSFSA